MACRDDGAKLPAMGLPPPARRARWWPLVGALLVLPATPVAAKAKKPAAEGKVSKKAKKKAKRMEKVGRGAYRKGKYGDAMIAFRAAYKAVPKPKFLYNLGRCHEKLGELAAAADHYERYLEEAPDAEDREEVETQADFLKEKLQQTMAYVQLASEPDVADFELVGGDEQYEGELPWKRWVPPGKYKLTVRWDDKDPITEKVRLKVGQSRILTLKRDKPEADPEPEPKAKPALKAEPAPKPAEDKQAVALEKEPEPEPEPMVPPPSPAASSGPSVAAWAALGVAGVGVLAFAVLGVMQQGKKDDLEKLQSDRRGQNRAEAQTLVEGANNLGTLANVSLGVTVAGALTGGWLLLSADDEGATAGARWTW